MVTIWKTSSILSHRENPSQNYIDILFQPAQNGFHYENKQQILVKMWWKMKLSALLVGKVFSLKYLKIKQPYDPTIPSTQEYAQSILQG